jgi:hypothetical protein
LTPPGTIHAGDALALQAQNDVITAYNALTIQGCDFGPSGPTDLAGQTLVPGVYCYSSTVQNSGVLTLNAGGDPNAVWVFKIGSALTTGPGSSVIVTAPAQACNVFWQVGSSATLDTTTAFVGNILALTSITMNTGATLDGRALARNGSVTLDTNTTDATVCAGVPPPGGVGLFKVFSPSTINAGDVSTLTITLSNTNAGVATLNADFTDNLPIGVLIAPTPNASTTCGGVVTAIAGGNAVTLSSGATIPGGTIAIPGFCTLTVDVTAATVGSFLNTLPVGALSTDLGSSPAPPGPGVLLIALGAGGATVIPTLNEWGMIIFMVLAGLMSIYYLRRQKAKA